MYTSIVSCNVKKAKFCSSSWSGGVEDVISQQPTSEQRSPSEQEAGPTSAVDLEKLIPASELCVERCHDIVEVLHPFHKPPDTRFYTVSTMATTTASSLLFYACLSQPPRENCCDVERKYKLLLIEPSDGGLLLTMERPYDCCLDMSSNCWICGCCSCGAVGGSATLKIPPDSTPLASIHHSYACYKPLYRLRDPDGQDLMELVGAGCGDCLPQYRHAGRFLVKSEDGEVGSVERIGSRVMVRFKRSLGLRWKLLVVGGAFVMEMMYFGGQRSGMKQRRVEEPV